MKYVRFDFGFALIPDCGDIPAHIQLSDLFTRRYEKSLPISAGFVRIKEGKLQCYGRSGSMGLDSKPEDSDLLAEQLGVKQCESV